MKIIKNYLYNVTYQIFVLIVPLVTVPYISRVIGPVGVGINGYTYSIAYYFFLIGGIGISMYGNREIAYVRDSLFLRSKIFWELIILRLLTVLLSTAAFIIVSIFSQNYSLFLLLNIPFVLSAAFDISWFFSGMEEFKIIVTRNIIVKVISIIAIFIFVRSSADLYIYVSINGFALLISNMTLWSRLKSNITWIPFREQHIFKHLVPALLLFAPQITIQVYSVLNKTFLGKLSSMQQVGLFDNSDKVVKMILAIVTATGTVMLPKMAAAYKDSDKNTMVKSLRSSFGFVTMLSISLMFGLMAISVNFSVLFFGTDFKQIHQVIFFLAPVIPFIAWSNVTGIQYLVPTKQNKLFLQSVMVGAFSNLVFNLLLIPKFHAVGADLASVFAELIVTVIQVIIVGKTLPIRQFFQQIWKPIVSGFLMFLLVLNIQSDQPSWAALLISIVTGVIFYIVLLWLLKYNILIEEIGVLKRLLKNFLKK